MWKWLKQRLCTHEWKQIKSLDLIRLCLKCDRAEAYHGSSLGWKKVKDERKWPMP